MEVFFLNVNILLIIEEKFDGGYIVIGIDFLWIKLDIKLYLEDWLGFLNLGNNFVIFFKLRMFKFILFLSICIRLILMFLKRIILRVLDFLVCLRCVLSSLNMIL